MNISKRNKKVAISRWKKKHSEERNNIRHDKEALLLKASICGFLAGDGSVQRRKEKNFYHHQIDFFPDDKKMMNTYIKQIESVYNKTPSIREHKGFYSVRFTSKVIYDDIIQFSNFGLKNWNFPESLFNITGAKENWLRSFFSAEAYVGNKAIKIQTINLKGMKKLSTLLKSLGIENSYYEYNSKSEAESPVGIVMIRKKENKIKFYNKIGFYHDRKTQKLKESLNL